MNCEFDTSLILQPFTEGGQGLEFFQKISESVSIQTERSDCFHVEGWSSEWLATLANRHICRSIVNRVWKKIGYMREQNNCFDPQVVRYVRWGIQQEQAARNNPSATNAAVGAIEKVEEMVKTVMPLDFTWP